jgi:hypothetical protein
LIYISTKISTEAEGSITTAKDGAACQHFKQQHRTKLLFLKTIKPTIR